MKNLLGMVVLSILTTSQFAMANGVTKGTTDAKAIAAALGASSVFCESTSDKVTLNVDKDGELRMIARYAGSISGQLDTSNEGAGEECGGLQVTTNAHYGDYILEDDYNDCEQGLWGYRIMFSENELTDLHEGHGHFTANAYATDQAHEDGAMRSLECSVN